jgi:DNA helicase-2/ATP-dependent DNA helicase PcrA
MDLNSEQLLAATHPQGEAALLLASAGSGKTTTLTARIVWLIKQGVPPRKILASTFTNKAAAEIRERVLKQTGLPEEEAPRLTTLHSLALSLIRKNPAGFGLGPRISPLDDYDQNQLLKRIVEREKLDINPYALREHIEYHRARGVGFRVDYTDEVHQRALREYAGFHALTKDDLLVWELFSQEKQNSSAIDFSDMIWLSLKRMKNDPIWLGKLQKVFDHVIVDECQDINFPQVELLNGLLAPDNRNLFLTGDLGQAIFSFQGGCPALIKEFSTGWRGTPPTLYKLVRNHRSVPQVVDLANSIQDRFTESIPLRMESFRGLSGEQGWVKLLHAETPTDIARMIAQQISNNRRPYKDYAILVRSSMQVRDIEGELVRARIPYIVRGGSSLLQTEEVRDILSYVRFATNPNDFSALTRATSAPKCGIGDVALENVRKIANSSFQGDLLQALSTNGPKFASFADTIKNIQKSINNPVGALNATIGLSGYISHLKRKYAKDPDKAQNKIENLSRLRLMIEGLTEDLAISTEDVVFQLSMDRTEKDTERGAVVISTIHSMKGLEAQSVFVTNAVESSCPHWRCTSEAEIEEERRLFYVAVTRARDYLTICIPEKVQRGQYLSYVDPSRFLQELGIR